MYGTVDSLRDKGFSYNMLAKICDTTIMVMKASKKDISVLPDEARNKMARLDRMMEYLLSVEYTVDPVAIFEEHILIQDRNGEEEWVYLYELWNIGRLSDNELISIISSVDDLYSYKELMEDYPMEYNVVDASDGYKSIICELPIKKMTPASLLFSS